MLRSWPVQPGRGPKFTNKYLRIVSFRIFFFIKDCNAVLYYKTWNVTSYRWIKPNEQNQVFIKCFQFKKHQEPYLIWHQLTGMRCQIKLMKQRCGGLRELGYRIRSSQYVCSTTSWLQVCAYLLCLSLQRGALMSPSITCCKWRIQSQNMNSDGFMKQDWSHKTEVYATCHAIQDTLLYPTLLLTLMLQNLNDSSFKRFIKRSTLKMKCKEQFTSP